MVKIKSITKREAKAIAEYEELLLKKFPNRIRRLMLFGSKARGDSNRASDVDLLIVLTKNGKQIRREIVELTHEPILHFEVLLSPIIVEEKFFKEWSPLLEHIKKDGITIWTNKKAKKNM
jgi:predicted nucleotidyltransferase